jgi:hypothetical protein
VVNDGLTKIFPELTFEESDPELDHAGNGGRRIGITTG